MGHWVQNITFLSPQLLLISEVCLFYFTSPASAGFCSCFYSLVIGYRLLLLFYTHWKYWWNHWKGLDSLCFNKLPCVGHYSCLSPSPATCSHSGQRFVNKLRMGITLEWMCESVLYCFIIISGSGFPHPNSSEFFKKKTISNLTPDVFCQFCYCRY